VLVRICVIAVALLLVGAPVQAAGTVDAQAEHACDALIAPVATAVARPTQARVAIVESELLPPPSPALSRIFRPPRLSFA
jgi:hypothetical protein